MKRARVCAISHRPARRRWYHRQCRWFWRLTSMRHRRSDILAVCLMMAVQYGEWAQTKSRSLPLNADIDCKREVAQARISDFIEVVVTFPSGNTRRGPRRGDSHERAMRRPSSWYIRWPIVSPTSRPSRRWDTIKARGRHAGLSTENAANVS